MTRDGERRYDDREVAEILERAADAEIARRPDPSAADGLTLAELRRVGEEAGLDPELISRAAAALDAHGRPTLRTRMMGFPVGVARSVPLPRPFTQEEWERMVTSFRHTFRARGRLRSHGDLREWSNGNLQALVEPSLDGWVLRFSTRKSDGGMVGVGATMIIAAILLTVISFLFPGESFIRLATILGLAGGAQIAWGAIRLPAWAGEREVQFERLGEEALHLLASPAPTRSAE